MLVSYKNEDKQIISSTVEQYTVLYRTKYIIECNYFFVEKLWQIYV